VKSSRISGFYDLDVKERALLVAEWAGLDETERAILMGAGLQTERADQMVENVVGTHALPRQWP
jgi:hydroxymethylglutaryl-CoA reductase